MNKNQIFWLLLFYGFILLVNDLQAQYYTYGQDPASQRWRQLRTNHFRLIYPEAWESQVQKQAQFLEAIREPLSSSLNSNPKPIPVVLRNQTMLSNGFVMWAPKRIELVTTIPYNNQAIDWMKYLLVHEFRHVVQVEAVNTSTTRFFSRIFGEHITGAVVGLHIPLWFLEGDAVLAETSFTRSGRGRLPAFKMPLTAQVLEQGAYRFDKATLGSYRDMVPDHYAFGYHLVAALQSKHGFEPFQAATRQVARTPFLPGSFARGIRKATGKRLSQNYQSVISELETEWQENLNNAPVSDYQIIETDSRFDYVNYINPQYIDDDHLIAFRTSPADIPRLVKVGRDGSEEILFTPGFGFYISMSYSNGLAAWLEINPDPRWEYRNWTNIRVLDIESGQSKLITKRGRFQAPRLSPDGSKIVAVELDETNQWALVIFDTSDGAELQRITDSGIDFIIEPEWSDCQTFLIAIAFVEGKGKSIVRTGIENPEFEHLFHSGFNDITEPAIHDSLIYFTGTWSGRDEIYSWDLNNQQLNKVLSSPFGATCASDTDDGSKILFSDYTSYGYQMGEAGTGQSLPVNEREIKSISLDLFKAAAQQENLIVDTITLSSQKFDSGKYNKFLNLFHFHSWFPAAIDVDEMMVNPGITAFSQDLMGTTVLALGYEYDSLNDGHKAFVDLSFKALYPVFDLRLETGAEDRYYRNGDSVIELRTSTGKITGGIGLPLSFTHNALIYGFTPRVSTSQEIYSFTFQDDTRKRGSRSVSYRLSAYAYRRMAFRDLYPRLGISVAASFIHTPFRRSEPFTDVNAGSLTHAAASIFLPGLIKHHSFRLYSGWQEKIYGSTYFGDAIRPAQGYHALPNDELLLLSASYTLPLWYPDLAIGSIMYAKRLKANFFYEHSQVIYQEEISNYGSFGFDILIDAHLLRMPMPYELGFRTVYLENESTFTFEFLWGVNFYDVGQKLNGRRNMLPTY
ncbi:MAG: hypothetical protein IH597_12470 [Bacteroidales bacterium]|nr:hypothetical protein [Bacteroidales bacterium]